MKVKYIVYALLIIGLGVLVGYRIVTNKKLGSENAASGSKGGTGAGGNNKSVRLDGVVVKAQTFENSISVSGSIEANEQVQLISQYSGLVEGIFFEEGTNVKRGQVLVQIDDSELQAQLREAQARENLAKENEKRSKILLENKGISQQEYDFAFSNLKALEAQTQLIKAQIAKTSVRAPFNGTIGLRNISNGEYLTPAKVIANLVNLDQVKITFSVPEKYSTLVKLNTVLKFSVQGQNKSYKATVYAIEPRIESATRTLQLRAKAENPNRDLMPGAFANVELPITVVEDALLVPTQAIIPVQNGKKVFINEKGKAKEVLVETSTRTEKDVLITSGLKPGDTLITTGIMSLKAETPVDVVISKND